LNRIAGNFDRVSWRI